MAIEIVTQDVEYKGGILSAYLMADDENGLFIKAYVFNEERQHTHSYRLTWDILSQEECKQIGFGPQVVINAADGTKETREPEVAQLTILDMDSDEQIFDEFIRAHDYSPITPADVLECVVEKELLPTDLPDRAGDYAKLAQALREDGLNAL